jgi:hypothetical protein
MQQATTAVRSLGFAAATLIILALILRQMMPSGSPALMLLSHAFYQPTPCLTALPTSCRLPEVGVP